MACITASSSLAEAMYFARSSGLLLSGQFCHSIASYVDFQDIDPPLHHQMTVTSATHEHSALLLPADPSNQVKPLQPLQALGDAVMLP